MSQDIRYDPFDEPRSKKKKGINASVSLYFLLRVSYCEGVMSCLAFALCKKKINCIERLHGLYI